MIYHEIVEVFWLFPKDLKAKLTETEIENGLSQLYAVPSKNEIKVSM
jgi:hypothetical protein